MVRATRSQGFSPGGPHELDDHGKPIKQGSKPASKKTSRVASIKENATEETEEQPASEETKESRPRGRAPRGGRGRPRAVTRSTSPPAAREQLKNRRARSPQQKRTKKAASNEPEPEPESTPEPEPEQPVEHILDAVPQEHTSSDTPAEEVPKSPEVAVAETTADMLVETPEDITQPLNATPVPGRRMGPNLLIPSNTSSLRPFPSVLSRRVLRERPRIRFVTPEEDQLVAEVPVPLQDSTSFILGHRITNPQIIEALRASLNYFESHPDAPVPSGTDMERLLDNYSRPAAPDSAIVTEHPIMTSDTQAEEDRRNSLPEHEGSSPSTPEHTQSLPQATSLTTPVQQTASWASYLSTENVTNLLKTPFTRIRNPFGRRINHPATEVRPRPHRTGPPLSSSLERQSNDVSFPFQNPKEIPPPATVAHPGSKRVKLSDHRHVSVAPQPRLLGDQTSSSGTAKAPELPFHLRGVKYEDLPAQYKALYHHFNRAGLDLQDLERNFRHPRHIRRAQRHSERTSLNPRTQSLNHRAGSDLNHNSETFSNGPPAPRQLAGSKRKKTISVTVQKEFIAKNGSTYSLPANIHDEDDYETRQMEVTIDENEEVEQDSYRASPASNFNTFQTTQERPAVFEPTDHGGEDLYNVSPDAKRSKVVEESPASTMRTRSTSKGRRLHVPGGFDGDISFASADSNIDSSSPGLNSSIANPPNMETDLPKSSYWNTGKSLQDMTLSEDDRAARESAAAATRRLQEKIRKSTVPPQPSTDQSNPSASQFNLFPRNQSEQRGNAQGKNVYDDPHHARPYFGPLTADGRYVPRVEEAKEEARVRGSPANIFDPKNEILSQSRVIPTRSPAPPPVTPAKRTSKKRPTEFSHIPSSEFNYEGHFRAPDPSTGSSTRTRARKVCPIPGLSPSEFNWEGHFRVPDPEDGDSDYDGREGIEEEGCEEEQSTPKPVQQEEHDVETTPRPIHNLSPERTASQTPQQIQTRTPTPVTSRTSQADEIPAAAERVASETPREVQRSTPDRRANQTPRQAQTRIPQVVTRQSPRASAQRTPDNSALRPVTSAERQRLERVRANATPYTPRTPSRLREAQRLSSSSGRGSVRSFSSLVASASTPRDMTTQSQRELAQALIQPETNDYTLDPAVRRRVLGIGSGRRLRRRQRQLLKAKLFLKDNSENSPAGNHNTWGA